jgi:hypothetical protein
VARFTYQVCQQQQNRITFVDGQWIGTLPLSTPDPDALFNSCPETWDYLAAAGKGGWELVAVVSAGTAEHVYQLLYLKHTA